MLTTARGSYAAHSHPSRYDHGPTSGHNLDDFHAEPERSSWWLVAIAVGFIAALWIGVHL